jgi:hypothetical protein
VRIVPPAVGHLVFVWEDREQDLDGGPKDSNALDAFGDPCLISSQRMRLEEGLPNDCFSLSSGARRHCQTPYPEIRPRPIDDELIAANPKVLCGALDTTTLQTATLTRSGVVTWSADWLPGDLGGWLDPVSRQHKQSRPNGREKLG